jgi:signal transduction histidine kinase
VLANIHEAIDNNLIILQYRLKANPNRPAIQIIKNYGDIPPIKCYLGQLNQVFMNILANAIDALEESNQGRDFSEIEKFPNIITISTELSNDRKSVVIKFKDNGIGIPEETQSRIFDHLFTTKSSEKGTGLGLSISRQIIEEKHGGSLRCKSVVGEGTELAIAIPINM